MEKNKALKVQIFGSGLTQKEVARLAEVPEMYISLAVQGKMLLNPERQSKIAEVLSCRVDEIFKASC